MPSYTFKLNEFERSKDEALIAWLDQRWTAEAGGGLRAKIGGFDIDFGRTGAWKWKTLGVCMGLSAATSHAVEMLSGGAARMPFWAGLLTVPLYASLAPALSGGKAAWSNARAEGAAPLRAFGALCKRYALKLGGLGASDVVVLAPHVVVALLYAATERLRAGLKGIGAAKASSLLNTPVAQTGKALDGMNKIETAYKLWKAGLLIKVAFLDGASNFQAEEIYASLAKQRMFTRWLCIGAIESASDPEAAATLSSLQSNHAPELALRASCERFVNKAEHEIETLPYFLNKIEASGARAWFAPAPGMPTLGELARSVGRYFHPAEDEATHARLAALQAEEEARALEGVVGEIAPARPLRATPQKPRL